MAATPRRLAELLSGPLDGQRFLVVCLDGFRMSGHLLVVTDLRDCGLDAAEGRLFVIDGGKALRAAIGSLREGLAETLTVDRPGVTGSLLRTRSRPNPSSR